MKRFVHLLGCVLVLLLLIQSVVPSASAVRLQIATHMSAEQAGDDGAERASIDKIPLYLQTDYPTTRYGAGTIETSGCSIVSLAMVATYLTDHVYLPDELAYYFGGRAVNNMARLEYGSEKMQLPYEKTWYFYDALNALKQGKIVIALMEEASIFTDSQHFIVLTGMTEDGKILVNDSFAPNYDRYELKNGFANGFDESDIICGFSGAWIYDKKAMPENPYLYREEMPVKGVSRYPEIELTPEEYELLAKVIWVEARGECPEGQQAVAEIVFNRMVSDQFSSTLNDVIYGAGQFRSVPYLDQAEPYQAQYDAIERALYGPNILPMDVVYFATDAFNDSVWGKIGGHVFCYAE